VSTAVAADEAWLTGVGGLALLRRTWPPAGDPRSVVVIAHGAGEHSGRYQHVADALVAAGHIVYALDHRGHGRSEGPRALVDRLEHAVTDLDELVVLASGEHPGKPVFLIGHSMGGAIPLRYAIEHPDRFSQARWPRSTRRRRRCSRSPPCCPLSCRRCRRWRSTRTS
jgi:alpha-beta hydrolase superfamily lysophospholipase